MIAKSLTIRHLAFTGPTAASAELDFDSGLNLIYGASNTGKSFTLKAIDLMFGGSKSLPDISERIGYDTVWLGFNLEGKGDLTLSRSINGGGYLLYEGLVKSPQPKMHQKKLGPTHSSKSVDNISRCFLDYFDLDNKFVAKDTGGQKSSLSFRDLAPIVLVDETSIQAERSPIESGQHTDRPKEHSVFRLLITGVDDSAIVPVTDKKTFDVSKAARLAVMEDIIADLDHRLQKDYPDVEDLSIQDDRLENSLTKVQAQFDAAQGSIRRLLEEKHRLSTEIPAIAARREEIQLHLERFAQLERIYVSDIERLGALEEAGFILALAGDRACPLCGAPPEAQKHQHGLDDVASVRDASIKEIAKIQSQRIDLRSTVGDLTKEDEVLQGSWLELQRSLDSVEAEINRLTPDIKEMRQALGDLLSKRDHVKLGLTIIEQRSGLVNRREGFEDAKRPSKADKPDLSVPGAAVHEFCQVVSQVLKEWEFPGERHVSFDEKNV